MTLFHFDEVVAWCEIEKYMEMSQQFCPGLQLLSNLIHERERARMDEKMDG